MISELTVTQWLMLGIVILFGYLALKTRKLVLMLLGFLIPVLIAASFLDLFELVQGVTAAVILLAIAVVALVLILAYKLIRQFGEWVDQHLGQ